MAQEETQEQVSKNNFKDSSVVLEGDCYLNFINSLKSEVTEMLHERIDEIHEVLSDSNH